MDCMDGMDGRAQSRNAAAAFGGRANKWYGMGMGTRNPTAWEGVTMKTWCLVACLLVGLAGVWGQELGGGLGEGGTDDAVMGAAAKELGVDAAGRTRFRLVRAENLEQDIAPTLYWRELPDYVATVSFPGELRLGGDRVIGPRQEVLPNDLGIETVYEPHGLATIPPGPCELRPGSLRLKNEDGRLVSQHPAIRIVNDEVRIRCRQVRFGAVDADGAPVPTRIRLTDGRHSWLRSDGPYNPLVIWLPVGLDYEFSFGTFSLDPEGKVQVGKLAPGVTATPEGFRLTLPRETRPVPPAPPADRLYLWSYRDRHVFAQGERPCWFVLVPRGYAGGEAQVLVGDRPVGKLALPAVTDRQWDARGFTLATADLPAGDLTLAVRAGAAASALAKLTVVPWTRRSTFLVHSMNCCTEAPSTAAAGLALLRDQGLELVCNAGNTSDVTTEMPRIANPKPGLPAELGWRRVPADELLETYLRSRLRMIDMTVVRGGGLYLEGLSYHHSYPPSVERMTRRMAVFAQQTGDYPSWWGPNYAWFPKPGGYAEAGVPTDAHVGDRNAAAEAHLHQAGFDAPTDAELKWYHEHKFSANPDEQGRALAILQRLIARWQAYNQFTFGDHNALYSAAVRQVRPDAACVLYDNAGHDAANRARSQFNDLAASCYQSYTDFGEWPMSAAFTTEWARGSNPGKPVWLTVDWGTSTEGMMKSLFHAFARGLAGGGCPVQASAGPELTRRGMGLRLIAQYGTVAPTAVPDHRVAILATLSQRMFDGRAYYAYHALYYHLTRLGFPAIIVDEEDALKQGIPAGVQALFIVRQEQPFSTELTAVLRRFQAAGGKVLATGDSKVTLPDVATVGGEVRDVWRLSGFEAKSHAQLWAEFREHWREPLTKALADLRLTPLASTDPERGLAVGLDVGPVRYVVVNADTYGTISGEFQVTEGLPVSFEGAGWQVRDLVYQRDVPSREAAGRTEVTVDLATEPTKLLALYRSPPATVQLEQGPDRFRARVTAADGTDLGAVPLAYVIVAPNGQVRDTLYRAAGDELKFPVGAHDLAGEWTVRVQELLTGITAVGKWTPVPPPNPETVRALPEVQVVDERQAREFAAAPGEKVIILEANQQALQPVAQRLADQLTKAGVKTRIWAVQPEDFDSIPVRWYPRAEDKVRLQAVAENKLIGYRQSLTPYIDTKRRAHIPERGGYTETEPLYMLGCHAIVFSGGRLAESLRAVTAWLPTPNLPGRGQGRLVVCFSPFLANRHVAVLAAHDLEGWAKAADRLGAFFPAQPVVPVEPAPVTYAKLAATAGREPVATPFVNLAPRRRILHLAAVSDGRAVVYLEGRQDNLAFVSADGQLLKTCAVAKATELTLTEQGSVWCTWTAGNEARGLLVDAAGEARRQFALPLRPPTMQPPNRSVAASFPVSPDGSMLAAGRFGGLQLGRLDRNEWRFYDDVPWVRHRYEVWAPRFPVGMTFSADGRYLFFTMDTRPTGFTNMSGDSFTPTGAEAVLVEVATGARIWALREDPNANPEHRYAYVPDSAAFVTHSGFAAVARDGQVTALADYVGQALLIGRDGKVRLKQQALTNLPGRRAYDWGPPGGVGVWLSPGGELALFAYQHKLVLAAGNKPVEVAVRGVTAGAVALNGAFAVAGLSSGEVVAYAPDGAERWRFATGGIGPALAAVSPDHTLVATNLGELIRLDNQGKEVWRVNVAAAADRERHPVTAGEATPTTPAPFEYRVPPTLEIAKAMLNAREVARWTPTGQQETAAGLTFYRGPIAIKLSAGEAGDAFVHLVYQRVATAKPLTVITTGAGGQETFLLDLPAPQYRVVDLPLKGPQGTVEVTGDGAVAECSLWAFTWPGPNLAYVRAGPGAEAATEGAEPGLDGLGAELTDLDQDGRALAGKVKEARIYVWNPDPDHVQGIYFPPRVNPHKVVDGQRFGNGRFGGWAGERDLIGPWFDLDLSYPVPLSVVATYDGANRQSAVCQRIAVFADLDAGWRDSGRVLGGALENDQFWRLFAINGKKARRLGVHVHGGSNGLSEVEAYPLARGK